MTSESSLFNKITHNKATIIADSLILAFRGTTVSRLTNEMEE